MAEKRWRGLDRLEVGQRPRRSVLVALVLASVTLITLDARGGADSPVEPVRRAVGEAFGPAEATTAAIIRPFAAVPDHFRTTAGLRDDVARLESENAELRREVESTDLDRNRLAELEGLTRTASSTGYDLVPAHVIALGSRQSFSHTVTIDVGTSSGVHADMTVLNNDGLVGRVVRATRTTATVVLLVDADSVVGGRLGSSMEIGFLRGRGTGGGEPARPRARGRVRGGRHRRRRLDVGQRGRRAVRLRHPDRPGHRRVQQRPRDLPACGRGAAGRLHRARPGRGRGAGWHHRPGHHQGRGEPTMNLVRALVAFLVVTLAVVLQVTLFPHFAWDGIVPNLALLVVVGAALVRGPQFAAVLGFVAGVIIDLAPPADHIAGRWALALVLVGYVAGRVRQDIKPTAGAVVLTVAASSFVGTSVYALSGLLLRDPVVGVTEMLQVILVAVVWDVLLTPFLLPPVMALFRRLEPTRVAY